MSKTVKLDMEWLRPISSLVTEGAHTTLAFHNFEPFEGDISEVKAAILERSMGRFSPRIKSEGTHCEAGGVFLFFAPRTKAQVNYLSCKVGRPIAEGEAYRLFQREMGTAMADEMTRLSINLDGSEFFWAADSTPSTKAQKSVYGF